ncbi:MULTISPECIES: capsular polysaccharide biosynthesis protein [Alphaproteobacteria]|uniref:Capsule polysaccharide biosynthesis protein n=2 Tax=Alphaproteobacteria TaxID=28211 RepID=A0A512HJQ9_9HYPH|nr:MULTISPECIES: capsular polysaccharide biosynthesis protein [Alphaproteobacteria]GEO85674.1 capsule polysaccharide biosynthesis protein [Ciceribacter naphthalenivorans]GLR21971.1 capsule polysaccharide biosynthesis protein [Ciceribacter naphthalenivorans]GLT04827.1 capsule polysaccharide biosynthesis protein [Sphingomonas psychrolutea]
MSRTPPDRQPVVAFHIHEWKRSVLEAYFPKWDFHYMPFFMEEREFVDIWQARIAALDDPSVIVWGPNLPAAAERFCAERNIPVHFVEDGFLRSVGGSAGQSAPFSLTIDRQRPFFDSRGPSDLEDLLNAYDFDADPGLIERAGAGIAQMLRLRIGKYGGQPSKGVADLPGGTGRRVLVVGQVESDASIRYGAAMPILNNDLVRLAAKENPDATILYKPHPDVLGGVRKASSDPAEVADLSHVLTAPVALSDVLDEVDHVYTITSLAGFEALMRGKRVTVSGSPFYSGWGLTDDRQPNPRRVRVLSLEALFAGVYLLYPRYFDPRTGTERCFETTLAEMVAWQRDGEPDDSRRLLSSRARPAPWRPVGPFGVLGWRHLLPLVVGPLVARIGSADDAASYCRDPIGFFREQSDPDFRRLGRWLYPRDDGRFAMGFDRFRTGA